MEKNYLRYAPQWFAGIITSPRAPVAALPRTKEVVCGAGRDVVCWRVRTGERTRTLRRGDETDLPDIGDAFPPPPPPPPPRRRIAREEPLDSFACGLLACVGAGEKLECLACGARCDALLGAAPTCDECGAAFCDGCRGTHLVQVSALASALACDGETTGWRCSDGNACAHQPHALRRVMLHWKPAAGATGTDAAEDDFFGDDEPPGGPSETITL